MREKCLYSELFWSACSRIPTRITLNTDTFYAVMPFKLLKILLFLGFIENFNSRCF